MHLSLVSIRNSDIKCFLLFGLIMNNLSPFSLHVILSSPSSICYSHNVAKRPQSLPAFVLNSPPKYYFHFIFITYTPSNGDTLICVLVSHKFVTLAGCFCKGHVTMPLIHPEANFHLVIHYLVNIR